MNENQPPIDIELRTLIKELNKVGLKTIGSCTGHNENKAFISFSDENFFAVEHFNINTKGHSAIRIRWKMPFKTKKQTEFFTKKDIERQIKNSENIIELNKKIIERNKKILGE